MFTSSTDQTRHTPDCRPTYFLSMQNSEILNIFSSCFLADSQFSCTYMGKQSFTSKALLPMGRCTPILAMRMAPARAVLMRGLAANLAGKGWRHVGQVFFPLLAHLVKHPRQKLCWHGAWWGSQSCGHIVHIVLLLSERRAFKHDPLEINMNLAAPYCYCKW